VEEIYAEHTGRSRDAVSADLERDRFFTAEQAREYGLVDRVTAGRAPRPERAGARRGAFSGALR
jgi:ATP-dependent Clp protease, protease subunit